MGVVMVVVGQSRPDLEHVKRTAVRALIAAMALSLLATAPAAAATGAYDPYFARPTTAVDLGAAARPFGVATGDFDGDGKSDLIVGRTTGHVAFVKGNGDGTFAAPEQFPWKQAFFNTWAFAPADVNGDGKLDVVWGATAASTGCSVSPVPSSGCPLTR
jgi:hypothetical protein